MTFILTKEIVQIDNEADFYEEYPKLYSKIYLVL